MKHSLFGFTLVELMVSITILGILAAIGIPAYREYIVHARTAEAYSTIESIGKLQKVFYSEHKTFMPTYPNPEGYPDNKSWNNSVVGWGVGWGGPFLAPVFGDGAQTHFVYQNYAGNENGHYDIGGWQGVGLGFTIGLSLSDNMVSAIGGSEAVAEACTGHKEIDNGFTLSAQSFGVTSSGDHEWVVMLAQGKLRGESNCRYVAYVLDANSNEDGAIRAPGGMILLDHDFQDIN